MNAAQSERARKAHEGYLALMAKRKNPEAFKPKEEKKPGKAKPQPRWPVGSSVWVPLGKAEGKVLEAVADVLGEFTYLVEYWGHLKPVRKRFTEDELKELDLS